jgi:hypothetical protein
MRVLICCGLVLLACSNEPTAPGLYEPCLVSCDDGDPCTDDACHPTLGVCIHHPNIYCSKACSTDLDCEFQGGDAACIAKQCVKGQCRYQGLAKDECLPCDRTEACPQSFCDPRECQNGFCRRVTRDCDDQDPTTLDRCAVGSDQCEHWLSNGVRSCEVDADCGTDHPCELFECKAADQDSATGVCHRSESTAGCAAPLEVVRSCEKNAECIQAGGDVCVAGTCQDGFCGFLEYPYSDDCESCQHGGPDDTDCEGTFCKWSVCSGTVCTRDPVPFCTDLDPLTTDLCSDAVQACLHEYAATPSACVGSLQSDDDPTTLDACDPLTGTTVHLPVGEGECMTADRCIHTYLTSDGTCLAQPILCDDFDPSTDETCDPSQGCIFQSSEAYCETDADCDDGNPCTMMVCLNRFGDQHMDQQTGVSQVGCWGIFVDDCLPCTEDADCVGDDWCIQGTCTVDGLCNFELQRTCDDGDPCTADFCHGWVNDTCTYHSIPDCEAP